MMSMSGTFYPNQLEFDPKTDIGGSKSGAEVRRLVDDVPSAAEGAPEPAGPLPETTVLRSSAAIHGALPGTAAEDAADAHCAVEASAEKSDADSVEAAPNAAMEVPISPRSLFRSPELLTSGKWERPLRLGKFCSCYDFQVEADLVDKAQDLRRNANMFYRSIQAENEEEERGGTEPYREGRPQPELDVLGPVPGALTWRPGLYKSTLVQRELRKSRVSRRLEEEQRQAHIEETKTGRSRSLVAILTDRRKARLELSKVHSVRQELGRGRDTSPTVNAFRARAIVEKLSEKRRLLPPGKL